MIREMEVVVTYDYKQMKAISLKIPALPSIRYNFEKILCPVDLSIDSEQAIRYAIALACTYNANLYFCHCIDSSLPDAGSRIKGYFTEMVHKYTYNREKKLEWQTIVVEGKPEEAIVNIAGERDIDLIVMHSRRRPLSAAILGSNAEKLSHTAPCPVLTMHQHQKEWVHLPDGEICLKRILVAYDFSAYSDLALSHALSLAQEFQAELYILQVLPSTSEERNLPLPISQLQEQMRSIKDVIPSDVLSWCRIKTLIAEGKVYNEILNCAEENSIDLICLGAHGTGTGKASRLGSTVDRVLRESSCPVFVARPVESPAKPVEKSSFKVLVATDGSAFGELVLAEANRIWQPETELRVITVMEPLSTIGPAATHYQHPIEVYKALETAAATSAESLKGKDRKVSYVVREGMAADEIIAEARDWEADLILLGTHGRRGISKLLLGSVAEEVAANSPCSVEIVKKYS